MAGGSEHKEDPALAEFMEHINTQVTPLFTKAMAPVKYFLLGEKKPTYKLFDEPTALPKYERYDIAAIAIRYVKDDGDRAISALISALSATVIRLTITAAIATMAMARASVMMAMAKAGMMVRQTQRFCIAKFLRQWRHFSRVPTCLPCWCGSMPALVAVAVSAEKNGNAQKTSAARANASGDCDRQLSHL